MDIAFGILGRTAVRFGGDLHEDWGTPRVSAVLATLLVHAGRAVSIDTLVDWAWPEETQVPQDRVSTFHTYATRIRRVLRQLSPEPTLHTGNGAYRLDVDKSLIDFNRFRSLITEARGHARDHDQRQARDCAERALMLWRGRPLDDLGSEPAQAWRTMVVRDHWLPANVTLLEALIALGQYDEALARLDDLQAEHDRDVSLAELRMSALHGLSRFSEEKTYYFGIRRRLKEEDADDQAAEYLRHHHEDLLGRPRESDTAQPAEPLVAPRQLPHDIADFVGRDDLLEALDAATARGGVVVLDGMAGVGKTALAVHWGHLSRRRFPDGDFFVNLNGFSDSPSVEQSTVVDDFLIALGRAADDRLSQRAKELLLSQLLANRRTLVVLDNARNTAHVKGLVNLLSSCLIVVTSRQKLTTLSAETGARRVRVEPMTPTEATELLSVRLSARRQVGRDDQVRLAQLCGGLPLVITVLAEHVATRSAAQLSEFAQRLDRRQLIVDIGEDGDGPANARTFFSWSYNALAADERQLFRLLSLHPGPDLSLAVACACVGRPLSEVRRSLGLLVGTHLLEQAETLDRYRFHDLLREFATHCVERDEPPDVRQAAERRIMSHYLAAATQVHRTLYPSHLTAPELPIEAAVEPVAFADTAQARSWFDRERKNVAAAIHFAAAQGHHQHCWRLADTAATLFDRRGYYSHSRAVRQLAVTSAAAVGDREAEASSQVGLGMVLIILGEHAEARRCLDAGLRFAEDTGNDRGQASTLHLLARLEMMRGDPATAIQQYRKSIEAASRIGDDEVLCWSHCRLGEALRLLEQHDQALIHLHQCQFHAQRIGDGSAHASSLAQVAAVFRDRGDHHTAVAYCEQALGIVDAMAIPDLAITTQISTTLAEINLARGDAESATRHALHAVVLARRTRNASAEADACRALGDSYFASGEPREALVAWRQAADLYEHTGNLAKVAVVRAKMDKTPSAVDLPATRSDAFTPDRSTSDTPHDHSASA